MQDRRLEFLLLRAFYLMLMVLMPAALFENKYDLLATFAEYKAEFEEGGQFYGEIPDVEGFCMYIDSYRNLLNEYEKREEYSGAIKKIKNWIYYKKKQLAMTGKMPPAIYIFDAINNAGYSNKTEQDITTDGQPLSFNISRGNTSNS